MDDIYIWQVKKTNGDWETIGYRESAFSIIPLEFSTKEEALANERLAFDSLPSQNWEPLPEVRLVHYQIVDRDTYLR